MMDISLIWVKNNQRACCNHCYLLYCGNPDCLSCNKMIHLFGIKSRMLKTDRRHLYKIYKVKTSDTVPVELITNTKIAQMRRVFFEEILASCVRVIST